MYKGTFYKTKSPKSEEYVIIMKLEIRKSRIYLRDETNPSSMMVLITEAE